MRTKEQIEYDLLNKLEEGTESSFWNDIRSSVIGKELIRFGVELIQQQEQIRESYSKSINLDYADYNQLAQVANGLLSFVSANRPASIVATVGAGVYPKYSLRIAPSGGKIYYYNIEPISIPTGTTKQVTLYQGILRKMQSKSYFDSLEGERMNITEKQVFYGDKHMSRRVNLGSAIPQSLSVYVYDNFIQEISPVTYLSIGNYGYVPYNFQDGSTGICIDTIFSKRFNNYAVQWLSPTQYAVNQKSFESYIKDQDPDNKRIESVDVIEDASFDDLAYAKSMVNKALASYQSVTEENVESYLSSDSRIDGVYIDKSKSPSVIYVKPSEGYEKYDFTDLDTEIKLHSSIGASFSVAKSSKIPLKYMFYTLNNGRVSKYDVSSTFSQYMDSKALGYCRQTPMTEFSKGVNSCNLTAYHSFLGLTFVNTNYSNTSYSIDGTMKVNSNETFKLKPFDLSNPIFFVSESSYCTIAKCESNGNTARYTFGVEGMYVEMTYDSNRKLTKLGVSFGQTKGTICVPCYFSELTDSYIHVDQVDI